MPEGENDDNQAADEAARASIEKLEAKNAELVEKLNSLSKKLQAFGDLTPEQAQEAAQKAKAAEEAELTAQGQFEELKKRLQTEHKIEVEKLKEALADRDGRLEKLLIDDGLTRAMDEVGVMASRREFVRRYFKAEQPTIKGEAAVVETSSGDVPLVDYVKQWAESKDADPFIEGKTANGSGSKNGDANGSPTKWSEMTETEKAKLWKSDNAKARQLAQASGAKIPA